MRMKVLLVNPPRFRLIQAAVPKAFMHGDFPFPPLGLLYVAASLEKEGLTEVSVLDAQWGNMTWDDIGRYAASYEADVVGVTTMTTNLVDAWEVLRAVKRHRPDVVTVMGGPHVSLFPEESARLPNVDYAIAGEAELTFPNVIQALEHGDIPKSIPGLHWVHDSGQYHNGGNSAVVNDLDALPLPDRTKLEMTRYRTLTTRSPASTSILSNRGCPYRCTFCDVPRTKVRYRSPSSFADEMQWCLQHGIHEFHVFDDTFNLSDNRVIAICRELINRKLKVSWSLRGRADRLTDEVAQHLKTAGCFRLHLGIESAVPRILELMKKQIDPEQVVETVAVAKRHGLQVHGFFLIGFPTETAEEIAQTVNFARRLRLDYAQFSVTTLYPGTEIYKWAIRERVVVGDVWRDFAANPDPDFAPPVWDQTITAPELYHLMENAYRSYYLRPSYVWQSLKSLRTLREFASKIKGMATLLNPGFGAGFRWRERVAP
jgi:anaerobic magnesium-protoporphyrin IX monomethyl ester cyclase